MDPPAEQHEPLPGHPVRVNPSPAPVHIPTPHARWLVAAVTVAVVVVLGVVLLPKYLLAWDLDGGPAPTDRAKAVNDIRTTLLQGLGGAALLIGAYFTWRQVQIAREGQLTERFTTAVGQLSNRSVDVRLGGIYALERIAIDSKRDRQTTYEVLCAYLEVNRPGFSGGAVPLVSREPFPSLMWPRLTAQARRHGQRSGPNDRPPSASVSSGPAAIPPTGWPESPVARYRSRPRAGELNQPPMVCP